MPSIIEHETMHVDDLPAVWSPVQWELSEEERVAELESQAQASLLWMMDAPEAILRLLLNETEMKRLYTAPDGYDEQEQAEWDSDIVTFGAKRAFKLDSVTREKDALYLVYKVGDLGYWELEIGAEQVTIKRI